MQQCTDVPRRLDVWPKLCILASGWADGVRGRSSVWNRRWRRSSSSETPLISLFLCSSAIPPAIISRSVTILLTVVSRSPYVCRTPYYLLDFDSKKRSWWHADSYFPPSSSFSSAFLWECMTLSLAHSRKALAALVDMFCSGVMEHADKCFQSLCHNLSVESCHCLCCP